MFSGIENHWLHTDDQLFVGFPAANAFVASAVTMGTGFPAFSPFVSPADGIITNPPATNSFGSTPANFPSPYVQSWNLSVQRALPWKLSSGNR